MALQSPACWALIWPAQRPMSLLTVRTAGSGPIEVQSPATHVPTALGRCRPPGPGRTDSDHFKTRFSTGRMTDKLISSAKDADLSQTAPQGPRSAVGRPPLGRSRRSRPLPPPPPSPPPACQRLPERTGVSELCQPDYPTLRKAGLSPLTPLPANTACLARWRHRLAHPCLAGGTLLCSTAAHRTGLQRSRAV
jgi:hypothetical protein